MSIIIIGGGVVGLSVAYGLLGQGKQVIVLDGDDGDFRASRGNFGLVWVQGKGSKAPAYAQWTRQSASLWKDYAQDLLRDTGLDVALSQIGGIDYFTDEGAMEQQLVALETLRGAVDGDYPFEALNHQQVKELVPEIGPKVVGGIYSQMDGHVNPLLLLRALSMAVRTAGGVIRTRAKVKDITAKDRDFTVHLEDGSTVEGEGLVLAAGLGALSLGHKLGFKVPIRPLQGQVLITEKLPFFMRYPSGTLRQVNEGGVQIGATKAEVGLDDGEDLETTAGLAQHAIDVFPHLAKVKLVRSWAALRIMSPDGLPIYQRSPQYFGATFVTCHSGITLSAAHARLLPDWVLGRNTAPDLSHFSESRFHV
ncbi:FAD-binding oxidoreductase [Agrobacterium vitis]|uniref:NAD(P)/FAD-dependent oxidoreductase n=1 Tax=Allorhizobium ampelinum TaxID=3025782 RepID=UPI001F1CDD3C|nr:FAD-dependent oxidoreductase [Allorhizobium ampelinum]MCF1461157.1 FAD-binding oxidoreductase [Allorhizobium ampelinum]